MRTRYSDMYPDQLTIRCIFLLALGVFAVGWLSCSPAVAASARFSQSCPALSFGDCAQFQYYWDHANMPDHYDCAFPAAAKQCWDPSAYVIKGCKASPIGLDFIAAHDAFSDLFRKAYAAGDFSSSSSLMFVWEDLNATLMDLLYPIQKRSTVEADIKALDLADAVTMAKIAVKYTRDANGLLRYLSTIAINLSACTDFERRIPGFTRKVLSQVMTLAGVWLVEGPVGDPVDTSLVYDGPIDVSFTFNRSDCGGSAARPSVLLQGQRKDGTSFSYKIDVGAAPVTFAGNHVEVTLIKKTSDWTRYLCATGTLSFH
ncbi:hypothetical protein [Mesorhizobium argentiipisi]|uniref:Uncharacterized protein n=1 Tax=Mesorhizobium argentiipisi TaxID=3015175 RepID=A0ABU8KMF7_9HYPH